jgi:hypothetical protein
MERTLAVEVVDIDDEISAWHSSAIYQGELPEWLGLTGEEYTLFVEQPRALPAIVAQRATMERAAWARLVKAQRAYIGGVGPFGDYEAAKQDLRDLGVDVDALLAD